MQHPTTIAIRSALPSSYSVEKAIGQGGQGSVFLGSFEGRVAAIKVYQEQQDARRIEREFESLQKIRCDNVVSLFDAREISICGNACWIAAYEYYPGGSLTVGGSPTVRSEDDLVRIAKDVLRGLEALWAERIVHRDIKPDNLVKAGDGRVVLVDLGLAKHLDLSGITQTGYTCGTMGYMSPEQGAGDPHLTIRSDIFSLGVSLYELATMNHPFGRRQHLIGKSAPTHIGSLRTDLTQNVANAIMQMMETRATRRPINAITLFDQS